MSKYLDKVPFVNYSRKEEWLNSISHMVGGGFAIIMLIILLVKSFLCKNWWYGITAFLYGGTMIAMYACSAVYHALHEHDGKKAMRLVDHTMVFVFMASSITPFALCSLRPEHTVLGWLLFGVAWFCTAGSITMIFINIRKTRVHQMILCMVEGWMVIFLVKYLVQLLGPIGFGLLLGGGVVYSIGAILYGVGAKKKYIHGVFHFFVIAASIMHFFVILLFVYK